MGADTTTSSAPKREVRATRLIFLAAGLTVAGWAPLVPYAAARFAAGSDLLGMLLLCFGFGSIVSMSATGPLTDKLGCRSLITAAGVCSLSLFPLLAVVSTPVQLGLVLFMFGASVGTVDVAMNIQAVLIEQRARRSLLSAIHGFFSLGGICGAAAMSGLLYAGLSPFSACLILSGVLAALFFLAYSGLLAASELARSNAPFFALPRGRVILVCLLCFAISVVEGSIIDWGAMFLTQERGIAPSLGGLGYASFALTMTVGRFIGDRLVARFGSQNVLRAGSISIALGFGLAVASGLPAVAVGCFALIGLGASNLAPILCSTSGRQQAIPASRAVAAIMTFGYAGLMIGPAAIGFVAQQTSLGVAFLGLGLTALISAASARVVR